MITSLQNTLVKETTKLHQKKYRKQRGLFLVEGYHLYEEAKQADVIDMIFTTDETITGDNVHYVNQTVLEKLAQAKQPQGILCVCRMQEPKDISNKILLLDHIQDPGNLGTLLRSALAFGFQTIVMDECVDVYNDKVLRATQGAVFHLDLYHAYLPDFIEEHSTHTFIGTAMRGTELDDVRVPYRMGVILGNEGAGVSQELLDATLFNVTIPMHQTESLNVGVAGSIIMYHCRIK